MNSSHIPDDCMPEATPSFPLAYGSENHSGEGRAHTLPPMYRRLPPYSRRKCLHPNRTALEIYDQGLQDLAVCFNQAVLIHFQEVQRENGNLVCDLSVVFYLGKIPDTFQRRFASLGVPLERLAISAAPLRSISTSRTCAGTENNGLQFLLIIEFQMMHDAEPVPERRGKKSCAGRRATSVNFGRSSRIDRAEAPLPIIISMAKSSMAG